MKLTLFVFVVDSNEMISSNLLIYLESQHVFVCALILSLLLLLKEFCAQCMIQDGTICNYSNLYIKLIVLHLLLLLFLILLEVCAFGSRCEKKIDRNTKKKIENTKQKHSNTEQPLVWDSH